MSGGPRTAPIPAGEPIVTIPVSFVFSPGLTLEAIRIYVAMRLSEQIAAKEGREPDCSRDEIIATCMKWVKHFEDVESRRPA